MIPKYRAWDRLRKEMNYKVMVGNCDLSDRNWTCPIIWIEAAIKNESVKQKEIDTAKQEQEKAKVEADTKKVQAQAEADAGIIKAEGEAKANKAKSDSITDNLIRMKEAEAREKHGWVTVNGAGSVITNKE